MHRSLGISPLAVTQATRQSLPRMSTRPVIFISAVSRELHSARDHVAKTLISLGYEPKWQDIAPTETGDLRDVLRKWVDASNAVIQLVGHSYGFAPRDADPDLGHCSYTQYETLYARQQGKQVWYVILSPEHPTDSCSAEDSALRELQDAYRKKVTGTDHLYHRSNSLLQTENIVLKLKDDLAELRKYDKRHTVLVVCLLVTLVLGGLVLMRWQQHTDGTVIKTEKKIDQQTKITSETQAVVVELRDQNDKILQAMRELPQTLSEQPRGDAQENPNSRISRAYTVLETQLQLPAGSLAKMLPEFAQKLLLRPDTSALDRANALFGIKKFADAEAEALKVKDHALAVAEKPMQDAITALRLAGQSAQAQVHYPQAMEHYRAAAALTSQERDILQWLELQDDISWLYHLQGSYQEELAQTRLVWQIAQQAGKEEATAVLAAHMNYAGALDDNGQAVSAETEYRAILQIQNRRLGAQDSQTLVSRHNLAATLQAQGKYAEAEQELRAVLQIQERLVGIEHPEVLNSMMNLAEALRAQGKHAEAEKDHREVLQIRERLQGAEHPETLASR
uniref:tetratricopeptide repeat protein n=1 Tax=Prosthecobacter sp. TaxID=1965333 RepID=UPI0037C5C7AD